MNFRFCFQPKGFFILCFICCLYGWADPVYSQQEDAIAKALEKLGIGVENLGFQPGDAWVNYPVNVPYKFLGYDDLFANPLNLPRYASLMLNTAESYVKADEIRKNPHALYKLFNHLALSRNISSFRGYGPNLEKVKPSEEVLFTALERIYDVAGYRFNSMSFNGAYGEAYHLKDAKAFSRVIPSSLHYPLARLLMHLADAVYWRQVALRNVDREAMLRIYRIRDFAVSQIDGTIYYPGFDDVEKAIDKHALYYSSIKVLAAVNRFYIEMDSLLGESSGEFRDIDAELHTPLGRIYIQGTKPHKKHYYNPLLIIDFGGDDTHEDAVAAASMGNPVSVLIDFEGDDQYLNEHEDLATQGSGIFGTGLLFDAGGDDVYRSRRYSQGMGVFGLGMLVDLAGNDDFRNELSGQGCGYFGIGMLIDGAGDDRFYLFGDGQGMGGVAGIGMLCDAGGDDWYIAEPDAEVFDLGDYHSGHKFNVNTAQGAGIGRRGDGSDGHSWAGGIGALIDLGGDDQYEAANFSQAAGYWFGLGLLIDGKGNDRYSSIYFSQASGAHFAMSCLLDLDGDDRHVLHETAGAGLAFGWDFVHAILVNQGGNDYYEAANEALGSAAMRANAIFIDTRGDDVYQVEDISKSLGAAVHSELFEYPANRSDYFYLTSQAAIFLDLSGEDVYKVNYAFDLPADSPSIPANNKLWFNPDPDKAQRFHNYGLGWDMEDGAIIWLAPYNRY